MCAAKRAAATSNPDESGAVGRAVIFELRGAGEQHVSGRPRRLIERHKKCAPARAFCCASSKARGRRVKRRGERRGRMPTQFEWARRGRARRGPTRPRRAPKKSGHARNDRGHVAHTRARAADAGATARRVGIREDVEGAGCAPRETDFSVSFATLPRPPSPTSTTQNGAPPCARATAPTGLKIRPTAAHAQWLRVRQAAWREHVWSALSCPIVAVFGGFVEAILARCPSKRVVRVEGEHARATICAPWAGAFRLRRTTRGKKKWSQLNSTCSVRCGGGAGGGEPAARRRKTDPKQTRPHAARRAPHPAALSQLRGVATRVRDTTISSR